MKNLMIYINPAQEFSNSDWGNEIEILAKIQIDNSLALGWAREDIVLVTNFPYEYDGVKAVVLDGDLYCPFSSGTPSKINVIVEMFKRGMITDDLWWFHDFDAFELERITQEEIALGPGQLALTRYGYISWSKEILTRWSTGVLFFDKDSGDVFDWIKTAVYKYGANEEVSLLALTRHNKHGVCARVKELNLTYNLATRRRDIMLSYRLCDKPLKVLHFHPFDKRKTSLGGPNMEVMKEFLPKCLIDIFNKHL